MIQPIAEVLLILFCLACVTIPMAVGSDVSARVLGRPTLGRDFWRSLLGGTALLLLLLVALTLAGALRLGIR